MNTLAKVFILLNNFNEYHTLKVTEIDDWELIEQALNEQCTDN